MIICHIWDADYPWDVRVEKICKSLTKKHTVHLVCRNSKRLPRYEMLKDLHIHRLPYLSARWGKLNDVIGFPAFCNPLWIGHIWQVVRRIKADVIIVRDLPLAMTAIGIGWLLGIPVILDMAENYPAMMQDLWDSERVKLSDYVVRNPAIVRMVERISLHAVWHILVVVEESRDRLEALGIPVEKITIVANTPPIDRLDDNTRTKVEPSLAHKDLVLIYLGLLERPRGLETAIEAVHKVREQLPSIRLDIIGTGRHAGFFQNMVKNLNLEEHVRFLGWIEYQEAIKHIRNSDVGLVPHHVTASWNSTIPNKLFDYMSVGKPVIVSDACPTKRIVMTAGCGEVFRDRDAEDLCRAILRLQEESTRLSKGRRGQEAVITKYNWSQDEQRLNKVIDGFTPKQSGIAF